MLLSRIFLAVSALWLAPLAAVAAPAPASSPVQIELSHQLDEVRAERIEPLLKTFNDQHKDVQLKLVRRATNLFDNRTLAIHPASTIFGPFTDEQRAAMDVLDTTIRISVGLEDMDDIVEDFRQAL